MKLARTAHTSRPWRVHELTSDFAVEDVWQLPTPGTRDDFPRLVRFFAGGDTANNESRFARALFALRWKLGEVLGWDDPASGVGSRVSSLRERLPADLRGGQAGPTFAKLPFTSVFLTDDEWAAEMANRTVHTVLHMSWVQDDNGTYHGQMAILVKPNGKFGRLYMAGIAPFRYLVVYPGLMRTIGSSWASGVGLDQPDPTGPDS